MIQVFLASLFFVLSDTGLAQQTSFKPLAIEAFSSEFIVSGKKIGGLSGVFFEARTNKLWAVSDSRKDFFVLSGVLNFPNSSEKIWTANEVIELKRVPKVAMDLEGLSILPWGNFILSSEGEQNQKPRVGPELLEFDLKGKFVREYSVPKSFGPEAVGKARQGVLNNSGLESLSISEDQKKLLVMTESHLRQDKAKSHLPVLIYSLDEAWNLKLQQELGYPFERIESAKGDLIDPRSGVSEALWVDHERIWILERTFSVSTTSGVGFQVRIYEWSLAKPGSKKLILDLNQEWQEWMKILKPKDSIFVGNFEAMTWGPKTKNGERTLWLMTDNNFSSGVPTVLLGLSVSVKETAP